jgi:hypothetical protein
MGDATLTDVVCQTTPARRDGEMLAFDVWCEVTRETEGTIRRVAGL